MARPKRKAPQLSITPVPLTGGEKRQRKQIKIGTAVEVRNPAMSKKARYEARTGMPYYSGENKHLVKKEQKIGTAGRSRPKSSMPDTAMAAPRRRSRYSGKAMPKGMPRVK